MGDPTSPSRRNLFELAARAAALPAGVLFFSAWRSASAQEHVHGAMASAPPDTHTLANYQPAFFSPDDFTALQAFTEILIPTDETPGAREAHCAAYLDFVLASSTDFAPEVQAQWRQAMTLLKTAGFHAADAGTRATLVRAMSEPERNRSVHHPAYPAFALIKKNNTFAFYTSREGSIEALDYRGNSYNVTFPACTHPEHREV